MTRFVDRGAVVAAWVGLGMAVTVVVSFVLVIPIQTLVIPISLLGGMLIGYYANARSERIGGPWGRVLANALFAGLVTGLTYAVLWLGVMALFFNLDNGYRDTSAGGPIASCQTGADCAYQQHLAAGQGPALQALGVTDAASFASFYWSEQVSISGQLVALSVVGGLVGGAMFGAANRRRPGPSSSTGKQPV